MQSLTGHPDAAGQPICIATLAKIIQHGGFDVIPEMLGSDGIDPGIPKNGKFAVICCQVKKHAVTFFGLMHFQLAENVSRPVQYIDPATFFHVQTDLARCIQLGISDGIGNLFFLFLGEKSGGFHRSVIYFKVLKIIFFLGHPDPSLRNESPCLPPMNTGCLLNNTGNAGLNICIFIIVSIVSHENQHFPLQDIGLETLHAQN